MAIVHFKSEEGEENRRKLEREFYNELDPRMRAIQFDIADYVRRKFGKEWTITCVNRPWDKDSAHGDARAVDARSTQFTDEEKAEIMNYADKAWGADLDPIGSRITRGRKKFLRIVCHVGTAEHFHWAINGVHRRNWQV